MKLRGRWLLRIERHRGRETGDEQVMSSEDIFLSSRIRFASAPQSPAATARPLQAIDGVLAASPAAVLPPFKSLMSAVSSATRPR